MCQAVSNQMQQSARETPWQWLISREECERKKGASNYDEAKTFFKFLFRERERKIESSISTVPVLALKTGFEFESQRTRRTRKKLNNLQLQLIFVSNSTPEAAAAKFVTHVSKWNFISDFVQQVIVFLKCWKQLFFDFPAAKNHLLTLRLLA